MQLTDDASNTITNTFTLVEGDYVCWFRDDGTTTMLMLYNGTSTIRLTEDSVDNQFSFVDGKIVWSESINNVYQIMLYDVNTHIKTQITNGATDSYRPVTDGSKIVWFDTAPSSVLLMWYFDIVTGKAQKVAHFNPTATRWLWLSNGKIAFSKNGEIYVYDGNVISQLTSSAPYNPNLEPYLDHEILVWNRNNPDPNTLHYGQIFRGKLHAHVSFDAENITGNSPLTVTFTNNSFQGVQTYLWDFGDRQTTTEKNPVHTYQNQGVYSVTLTVNGPAGTSSEKKINLIRVGEPSSVKTEAGIPDKFVLYQNYPNPFNPTTTLSFVIGHQSFVTLKVFDVLGKEIVTLVNEEKPAGEFELTFDASNLSSGVYFYKIRAGSFTDTKKFVLIR